MILIVISGPRVLLQHLFSIAAAEILLWKVKQVELVGVIREAMTCRSDANTNLQAFSPTMETHSLETVTMTTTINLPCVL